IRDCRECPLKQKCTKSSQRCLNITSNHISLIRLRADSKTDSFKKLYRSRAPVIEGIFAEAKQWHGLRRAWRRGLSKIRIQSLLIASILNFKQLIAVLYTLYVQKISVKSVMRVVFTIVERRWFKISEFSPLRKNVPYH
ncbi:MAG: transposase, partial [bacterium]